MRPVQFLTQRISADRFDARLGQHAAFGVSVLVFVLGLLKLTSLPLTEYELFCGLLLVGAVSLLCGIVGLLLPIAAASNRARE